MKIRLLVAIVCILFVVVGWTTVNDNAKALQEEYNTAIENARENVSLGLMKKALSYYAKALEAKESVELRCEITDALLENKCDKEAIKQIDQILELYPDLPCGYEYYCIISVNDNNIEGLFSYAQEAKKRGIQSNKIDELAKEHRYDYRRYSSVYADMKPFSGKVAIVYSDTGRAGYLNLEGELMIPMQYKNAAPGTGIDYLAVTGDDGETKFVDFDGDPYLVDADQRGMVFDDVQGYASSKMAVLESGYYRYIDKNFDTVAQDKLFLFAGTFSEDVAAAQTEKGWILLDSNQNMIGDKYYDDILVDENGIAFRYGVAFVKDKSGWYMVDASGAQLLADCFEGASLPKAPDEPIAVKKQGQWGFIDFSGNVVIPFQYDGARSFCNGMASVEVGGEWGVIEKSGGYVIEPQFESIYEVSSKGVMPVKTELGWSLIKFYSIGGMD